MERRKNWRKKKRFWNMGKMGKLVKLFNSFQHCFTDASMHNLHVHVVVLPAGGGWMVVNMLNSNLARLMYINFGAKFENVQGGGS